MKFNWIFFILLLNIHSEAATLSTNGIDVHNGKTENDVNEKYVDSLLKVGTQFMYHEEKIHDAKKDLLLAYQYARDIHYHKGITNSCKSLGNYYLSVSDNENATMYYYLFLKEAEGAMDSGGIADAHMRLGLVMYNMNKWTEALIYFNLADSIISKDSKSGGNIQLIYYLKGICYVRLENYNDAAVLLKNVLDFAYEEGDTMRIYETRLALNTIRTATDFSPEVYAEFDSIIRYFKEANETIGYCFALEGRAKALLKDEKADEAFQNASEALKIAKELNLIYPVTEIMGTLIEAEIKRNNFASAYNYLKELTVLNDSTNSLEVATQIALLGASYQFEKIEAEYDEEIAFNSRQNRFLIILLLALLVVALVIVYILRMVRMHRKRLDVLLHNILPSHTVKELQQAGHSIPKAHTDVTIVFADVKSFTTIASNLKPAVLVKMLDRYFGQFDKIITKYGLEKIKTIGDAYMFVSGLTEDSASVHKTGEACLEMIESINKLRPEMQEEFGIAFEFRFGMHTGNVVSGVVGDIKYAFDIWGDAVNIAARMEESSETGKINISHKTMNLLKDEYNCTPRGSFKIKNRGVVEMYFLEGKSNGSTPIQEDYTK